MTSRDEFLPTLELGSDDADVAFIWLHGLGDTGHGHEDVVNALPLPAGLRPRFVLPHAPSRPVTLNGGMVMPAWYDIRELAGGRHDLEGVRASSVQILRLLDRERDRGVPPERTFLCGFSQGGVIALHLAGQLDRLVAGVVGLSTYRVVDPAQTRPQHLPPVFLGHGRFDPMVPVGASEAAEAELLALGHPVTRKVYPMEHSISPHEIRDVGIWIAQVLDGET